MLKHYIKTTLRGFKFHPFYSFVSIFGLSIGLASCMLIFSYWSFEKSYDSFHSNPEKIYRISQEKSLDNGSSSYSASTFSKVGQELRSSFPEAESVLRIHRSGQNTSIQAGDRVIRQEEIIGAETTFFDFFDFKFISGSENQWKNTPQSVILTQSLAKKLFGNTNDPIGNEIIINGVYGTYQNGGYQEFKNYTVAGVIEEIPANTHLDFSAIISLALFADNDREFSNWGDQLYTYVKLINSGKSDQLNAALAGISETIFLDQGITLHPQELKEIHLKSNLINEFKVNGNEQVLILLTALALLVLVIAGCNYVNFATARAIQRHKEIGLRKIFWANKTQLFFQILVEAIIVNLIGFGSSFLFIALINPALIELTGVDLLHQLIFSTSIYLQLGILILAILFSGFYPAWLISKSSIHSLSSKPKSQLIIQRPLIVFQFSISIFVIGFTLLISSQLNFMMESNSGMELEKTLVLSGPSVESEDFNLEQRINSFQNSLKTNPKINGVTSSNFIPGKLIQGKAEGYVRKISDTKEEANTYSFTQIDTDFITEFGIQLEAGRTFDPKRNERQSIIINEEAAKLLGFNSPNEAIGERIYYRRNSTPEIIGVVKNFHQFSLQQAYQPIIFELGSQPDLFIYLKYDESIEASMKKEIKDNWEEAFPGNPFNYFYLNDYYNKQYSQDQNFYKVFQLFSGLGILVASLGFFGLTYFLATSKVKEIGIRKTLGARFIDITKILGQGTLSSLIFAGLVSVPLIYFLGNKWLENYAFRIEVYWWILIAPLVLFAVLSVCLILIQSVRSYRLNPIDSLQEGSNGTLER